MFLMCSAFYSACLRSEEILGGDKKTRYNLISVRRDRVIRLAVSSFLYYL